MGNSGSGCTVVDNSLRRLSNIHCPRYFARLSFLLFLDYRSVFVDGVS